MSPIMLKRDAVGIDTLIGCKLHSNFIDLNERENMLNLTREDTESTVVVRLLCMCSKLFLCFIENTRIEKVRTRPH